MKSLADRMDHGSFADHLQNRSILILMLNNLLQTCCVQFSDTIVSNICYLRIYCIVFVFLRIPLHIYLNSEPIVVELHMLPSILIQ